MLGPDSVVKRWFLLKTSALGYQAPAVLYANEFLELS